MATLSVLVIRLLRARQRVARVERQRNPGNRRQVCPGFRFAQPELRLLILVFVIWIAKPAEAAILDGAKSGHWRKFQEATETRNAQFFRTIPVTHPSNAIQFRPLLLDVGVFARRKSAADINMPGRIVQPDLQSGITVPADGFDGCAYRERVSFFHNVVIKAHLFQDASCRSVIDESYFNDNRFALPNVSLQNDMLDSNCRPMSG